MFHESVTTTTDIAVLPCVLGCRPLRHTIQVCLGINTLRLPGGTSIFVVSYHQFMKHPGLGNLVDVHDSYPIFESSSGKGMVEIEDKIVILYVTYETKTRFAR